MPSLSFAWVVDVKYSLKNHSSTFFLSRFSFFLSITKLLKLKEKKELKLIKNLFSYLQNNFTGRFFIDFWVHKKLNFYRYLLSRENVTKFFTSRTIGWIFKWRGRWKLLWEFSWENTFLFVCVISIFVCNFHSSIFCLET